MLNYINVFMQLWWYFFKEHTFFKNCKILQHVNCLSYNKLYCHDNSRKFFSGGRVYKSVVRVS